MKKTLLSLLTFILSASSFAQCPDLFQVMVNSCGTSEGNNEFVVFTTNVTATVSTYTANYGSTNPPTVNNLAGSDATVKTGTGSVTAAAGCSVTEITNPNSSIPSGSRVIFISANLDQNYDVTGLCNGSSPLYVVYILTNANGGTNSNWSTGGTISNSATSPRYMQVTYSGSANCNSANAPVKSYTASGNWPVLSGTVADGNFVTWNGTTAGYYNNGCTNIIVPVTLINLYASFINKSNSINWQTSQEINSSSFVIEKSYDGKNFIAAGTLTAAGYSNNVRSYHFSDQDIEYRATYYRIKTVDRDGQFSLSKIVRVNPSRHNFSISNIYPKPANEILFIEWNNSGIRTKGILIVMDVSGRVLKNQPVNIATGFNKQQVDISALPHGRYIIKLISDQNMVMDSFIK